MGRVVEFKRPMPKRAAPGAAKAKAVLAPRALSPEDAERASDLEQTLASLKRVHGYPGDSLVAQMLTPVVWAIEMALAEVLRRARPSARPRP